MDHPVGSWAARGGLGPWNTSMRSAEPHVSEVLPVQGLLHWVCGTDVIVLFSVEKQSERGNHLV